MNYKFYGFSLFIMSIDNRTDYAPGDPILIKNIVTQLKSQGVFDQFRKECISDVDTKPAYQNLCHRVDGQISSYLDDTRWVPDLNKNQLRENIRKYVNECHFVEPGIARIVDQLVNPRINTVLVPKVEDIVYKYVGIKRNETNNYQDSSRKEIKFITSCNDELTNNNYSNDSNLNNNRDTAYSKLDKTVNHMRRASNNENLNHENNENRSIFEGNEEENYRLKSPHLENKHNNNNASSSNMKNEQPSIFSKNMPNDERNMKPVSNDLYGDVKLEETQTYSNVESDEENIDEDTDVSPPFELHRKSYDETPGSVESDYSAEVFEWKDNLKEKIDDANTEVSNEEINYNNSKSTTKEEDAHSFQSYSYPSEIIKKNELPSASLDIPKTPTINYVTSDESDDNNFLKQCSTASHGMSLDHAHDVYESDIPDFSNVDKIAQKIEEKNRDDITVDVPSAEFSKCVDFDLVDTVVPKQDATDEEFLNKSKEKKKDERIDKRRKDDKTNSSKSNESCKDLKNRDKKHSDYKKVKEKRKSDKRDSGRTDKDRKNNKEKDKSSNDLTKVNKNSKEKHDNFEKSHKNIDEKDRLRSEHESGTLKLFKNNDEMQTDRKPQKSHVEEKKSREKDENKLRDFVVKSNLSGEKRPREEKTKDKRLKSDDLKEEKKKNHSHTSNEKNGRESKINITNQDEDFLERKSKTKKNDNSNGKKNSKNQCSSDEKKIRDRRSSDRDSNGPSSSSYYSHHRSSSKSEKEKHSDKSKYSSSSSHKSKKNDNLSIKNNNRTIEEIKISEKLLIADIKNEVNSKKLLNCVGPYYHSKTESNVQEIPVDIQNENRNIVDLSACNIKNYFSNNGKQFYDHAKNVDVDDIRLEMMLKSIHGDNEIHFEKYSEESLLNNQQNQKNANAQSDKNQLKKSVDEHKQKQDSEDLINMLNDFHKVNDNIVDELKLNTEIKVDTFEKNNTKNGELISAKLPTSACEEFFVKKPKIARNEFEFEKVVKLRKQFNEKMKMLQLGKENNNNSESVSSSDILFEHSSVNDTIMKDNGMNLGKHEILNDSMLGNLKTMKLNITRVDTCYRIVNGTCSMNYDENRNNSITVCNSIVKDNNNDNINNNNNSNNINSNRSDNCHIKNKSVNKNHWKKSDNTEIEQKIYEDDTKKCKLGYLEQSLFKKKGNDNLMNVDKKMKNITKKNELTNEIIVKNFHFESNLDVTDMLNHETPHSVHERKEPNNEVLRCEDEMNILSKGMSGISSSKIKTSSPSYTIHDEDSNEEYNDSFNVGEEENLREINIEEIIGCPKNITRISYESEFNEQDDTSDIKDEIYNITENSSEIEKNITIYDENNKENVESNVLDSAEFDNSSKKGIIEDVFYFEAGNRENDFKKFVGKKLYEFEDIYLENFSITLHYAEKYDTVFQNQLGATVKRNTNVSNRIIENLTETSQNPIKYNSEIINYKSGDDKGIMMRIKMFHEVKNESFNEESCKSEKTQFKICDSETFQLVEKNIEVNTNSFIDDSPKIPKNLLVHATENTNVSRSLFKLPLENKNSSPVSKKNSNKIFKTNAVNATTKRKTLGIKRKIFNTNDSYSQNSCLSPINNNFNERFENDDILNESSLIMSELINNGSSIECSFKKMKELEETSYPYETNRDLKSTIISSSITSSSCNNISSREDHQVNSSVIKLKSNSSRLLKLENKEGNISNINNSLEETNLIEFSKNITKEPRRNSLNKFPTDQTTKEIVSKRTTYQTKCYYDNSDLYKPRPSFLLTTRRKRTLNNDDTK